MIQVKTFYSKFLIDSKKIAIKELSETVFE